MIRLSAAERKPTLAMRSGAAYARLTQQEAAVLIEPVPAADATGAVADMYAQDERSWGFLPGFTQLFSLHPDAYTAWRQLIGTVQSPMDPRRYELVTLAAARTVRSSSCATAHGARLARQWYEPEQVASIAADHHAAGLDDIDVALMDFAVKVATDAPSVTAEEVDHLRGFGLSDRDILDVVLAVAARLFFTTVIEALAAGPDRQLTDSLPPALREALLVGRRPQ